MMEPPGPTSPGRLRLVCRAGAIPVGLVRQRQMLRTLLRHGRQCGRGRSAVIAAIIVLTVPWFTFRLALRQDDRRWLREQRTELYVDLLTEAYAEEQYLQYTTTDPETQQHSGRCSGGRT
jgi:hypothetical protein